MSLVRRILLLTVAGVLVAVAPLGSTSAHTGRAVFDVETHQIGARQLRVEVGISYADDKEVAGGAIVDATVVGPAGQRFGPVRLRRTSNDRYVTTLSFPAGGDWTIELRSSFPPGSTTVDIELTDDGGDDSDGTSTIVAGTVAGVLVMAFGVWRLLRRRP